MITMKTFLSCKYGPLHPKVDLLPDFFTGFDPHQRQQIVAEEARFYKQLTTPFTVDDRISTRFVSAQALDGAEIPIKVYEPRQRKDRLPVIMFFHGGGYITCSVETHDYVPAYLASNANVVVCSVDYRLAPEYKFPRGLEDCYQAAKWVASNKDELNIDASKLMVCGDSSGGNFATVICLMAKDRQDLQISRQVLIYPVTDNSGTVFKNSAKVYAPVGSGAESSKGVDYIAAYTKPGDDLCDPYISPLLADDTSGLPPALFIQAECDSLLDDGLMYAYKLADAGCQVECKLYVGMPHAFILRTYEETFQALDDICSYIRNH